MGWDDGDKGNPWRPNGGEKGPADLDAIVRSFQRKLSGIFGGGRGGSSGSSGPGLGSGLMGFAAVLLLGIWAATGFYMVDAAERGVVLRFGDSAGLALAFTVADRKRRENQHQCN